jgi:hypothetical protein
MTKSLEYSAPVFFHVDSLPSMARAQALDVLIGEIKDHLESTCYPLIEELDVRDGAYYSLRNESITIHSENVKSPKQKDYWECGYNVLHTIHTLTVDNCCILQSLKPTVRALDLFIMYKDFDATQMRMNMAERALKDATEQRQQWIDTPTSCDSSNWLPCQILNRKDWGTMGVWYSINFRIITSDVTMWCQLPDDNECLYWKHTD